MMGEARIFAARVVALLEQLHQELVALRAELARHRERVG